MKSKQSGKKLAKKMIIALICGLVAGLGCILLRENLLASGQESLWNTINNVLFQECVGGAAFGGTESNPKVVYYRTSTNTSSNTKWGNWINPA